MSHLPVIDITGLKSERIGDRRAVAAELGRACREIGFFYVVGHECADGAFDAAFAASRAFFAQPLAAKEALSIKRSDNDIGYIALEDEQLDPASPADFKEAFNIGLELSLDRLRSMQKFVFGLGSAQARPALPSARGWKWAGAPWAPC